jgi:ribosome biogenesis GTPase / thiamine phosphate phosphatase
LFVTQDGVLLVDTPGMREFALSPGDEEDVGGFEDVESIAQRCRFRDCRHRGEPDCAVAEAVRRGELAEDRLASFHQLSAELAAQRTKSKNRSPAGAPSSPHKRTGRSKPRG